MGNCNTYIKEVRFTFDDELTQAYIFIDAVGDCPIGVQGWHHKTFPSSKSAMDIMTMISTGEEEYLLWSLEAPN